MKPVNALYSSMGTTIFEVMSQLALKHGAINLGQGFPDVDGPEDIRRVAAEATIAGPNQYPSMLGIPELRQAVAAANQRFYGLDIDWQREVVVTSGATEALADCILALISPGDEAVLFEPLYDCYAPMIRRAGGIPRFVRLAPPDWAFTEEMLDEVFSERTKLVLINNPTNPAGKVFSRAELEMIAERVLHYDAYAICDEVYEHIVFDGAEHIPLMALPGMRERTLRIGSAGKTFSLTGWKIGYISGPAELMGPVAKAHQFVTFTTAPNLQKAVAAGLNKGDEYYAALAGDLQAKRDRLVSGLEALGLPTIPCAGTYFATADIGGLGLGDDQTACQRLTVEAGVTAVPVSAFYETDAPKNFVRFCFCKRDEVLDEALDRLKGAL